MCTALRTIGLAVLSTGVVLALATALWWIDNLVLLATGILATLIGTALLVIPNWRRPSSKRS